MPNTYVALTCVIGCLFVFAIGGCGSDTEDLSEEPANNLPMVRSLTIPEEFEPGETIELKITAHDPDGDTLSYTWRVSAGKLDATTGSTVKWTAPSDTRSVTITVQVHDGPDSSITRSRTVTYVSERLPEVPKLSIIPGNRAAGIHIGDPFNTVIALYGKPEDPIGKDRLFTYWDIGLAGSVDDNHNVTGLFILRPNKAKTPGGIGVGSTLKQVEDEFGPAEEIDKPDGPYWYWRRGISFLYDANSRVERIHIFTPTRAAPAKAAPVLEQEQRQQAAKELSLYQRRNRYDLQEAP